MKTTTRALASLTIVAVSLAIAVVALEGVLRVKNASMKNYDIEMWRYSRELKRQTDNPVMDFTHARSRAATLQSVEIRLNEHGLRGAAVSSDHSRRRILFLGGSITLGWGVPEAETTPAVVEQILIQSGRPVEVLNAGVGNYNAERYVTRFFTELQDLSPDEIVVQYFLRDAEDLPRGGGNWLLRNSQLAVTMWSASNLWLGSSGESSLVEHYERVYRQDAPGFVKMKSSLSRLAAYARERSIPVTLAMTPDVHNLVDYKFGFVHDTMRGVAAENGFRYVDLLPALAGRPPEELFVMPGDPHPNALGHKLMATAIAPTLTQSNQP